MGQVELSLVSNNMSILLKNVNIYVYCVTHPKAIFKVFGDMDIIDNQNNYRKYDPDIDKFWFTETFYNILFTANACGITVTNCCKIFCVFVTGYYY